MWKAPLMERAGLMKLVLKRQTAAGLTATLLVYLYGVEESVTPETSLILLRTDLPILHNGYLGFGFMFLWEYGK